MNDDYYNGYNPHRPDDDDDNTPSGGGMMPFGQPGQFGQPFDQPFGQPGQFGQPFNQPFGQPGQFGQPFNQPFGQPGQFGPPFGMPFGQPGQFGPPFGMPFAQQGQFGPPSGPPPGFQPQQPTTGVAGFSTGGPTIFKIDAGAIRPCRFRFVFIWPERGRGFWAWLTFVGRNSIAGWRWNGFRWVFFGLDLDRIESFFCL